MFDQLDDMSNRPKARKPWSLAVSVIVQALIIGVLIVIPLIFTEALPSAMLGTFLVAPPPPAPPPPPAAVVKQPKTNFAKVVHTQAMVAPTVIPKKVEVVKDEAAPAVNSDQGVVGGLGNTLGGLGNAAGPAPPPPPPTPQRIHVGGNVEAAALVNKVTPSYPPIARSAHVQGTVILHAVISKEGTIQELKFVSGPALLMQSAMAAVKEWRYRPTLLNGQPVEVDTTIDVVFSMNGMNG